MGKIIDDAYVLLELGISTSPTDEERAIVQQAVVKAEGAVKRYLRYDPAIKQHIEYYPQADFQSRTGTSVWEIAGENAVLRRKETAASNNLQLLNIPIRASAAIEVRIDYDGRFGTKQDGFGVSTVKAQGVDFWPQYDSKDSAGLGVCRDGIIRSLGRWPTEPGSVKVTYTAGYTSEEIEGQDDVIDASAIMEVIVDEALRRAKKVLTVWKKNAMTGHNAGAITSENLGDYSYSLSSGLLDKLLGGGSLTGESEEKLSSFVHWGLEL